MIDKRISIDLDNPNSITKAIEEIEKIKQEIEHKMKLVAERLADIGIVTATTSASDDYKGYIEFSREIISDVDGTCEICMYAKNVGELRRTWNHGDGVASAVIDAVMMNEVGSGWKANNVDGLSGAGQGTFPGQKHAFDRNGWFWVDESGKHHSYGENGNLSMHKAFVQMSQDIYKVCSEVF